MSNVEGASVTVDLGKVRNDVFAFELHCFNRTETSINLPVYCDVLVSNDGKSFTKLRRIYSQNCNQENYAFALVLSELISARYVKFSLAKGTGYCWIEEAAVFANFSALLGATERIDTTRVLIALAIVLFPILARLFAVIYLQ